MTETLLFAISAAITVLFLICVVLPVWLKRGSMNLPFPFLHIFNITYSNTYIFSPALMYQAYFWTNYFNVIK